MDSIPLILFLLVFILILFGYPVALTLGGISILAGLFFLIKTTRIPWGHKGHQLASVFHNWDQIVVRAE